MVVQNASTMTFQFWRYPKQSCPQQFKSIFISHHGLTYSIMNHTWMRMLNAQAHDGCVVYDTRWADTPPTFGIRTPNCRIFPRIGSYKKPFREQLMPQSKINEIKFRWCHKSNYSCVWPGKSFLRLIVVDEWVRRVEKNMLLRGGGPFPEARPWSSISWEATRMKEKEEEWILISWKCQKPLSKIQTVSVLGDKHHSASLWFRKN